MTSLPVAGVIVPKKPNKLNALWLQDKGVQSVVTALGADHVRFVGGAVRNSLMGLDIKDIDAATVFTPDVIMQKLGDAGIKTIPTGLKYGTVTAISHDTVIELTTLRQDIETYGRHATVAFTDNWQKDAARRDFTMNAVYLDADGCLHDYFNGLQDISSGCVRFIRDPRDRISEDGLRILRFFRFYAHYGRGDPPTNALQACHHQCHMIQDLSAERIRNETLKTLKARDPCRALHFAANTGVLACVFGEKFCIDALITVVDQEQKHNLSPNLLARLIALLYKDADVVQMFARNKKLSNKKAKALKTVLSAMSENLNQTQGIKTALYRCGPKATLSALLLQNPRAIAGLNLNDIPAFPLKGRDIIATGIVEGPNVGLILNNLENKWIESGFTLNKAALISILDAP